jgi:hypothetical protein
MEKTMTNTGWTQRSKNQMYLSFNKEIVVELICFLLILLFVYAAISKLLDYQTFKIQLAKSPYITNIAAPIANTLPIIEILIGILLVVKRLRLLGFYASFFIMVLFTTYIYFMLHYSYFIPCSCGGILSKMTWNQHLIFNIIYTALALCGTIFQIQISTK